MHYDTGHALVLLAKAAGDASLSYGLTGKLYFSKSGWLLLSVPNALGNGAFDALNEPGVELPSPYNAHITVMSPSEIDKLGGAGKITERGHEFTYTLGPVRTCEPDGQADLARVWFIEVRSPDLEKLRKSYGLSATPKDGEYQFHITFAARKKHVLRANPVAKAASLVHDYEQWQRPGCRRLPRFTPTVFFADC